MKRLLLIILSIIAAGCSSSTSRLMGSLSEPVDIEVAIPHIDTDAVPLLYGFVSDSYKNAIYPLNLSLRKFIESDVPYFPGMIPVGRYPTRISVDRSQKRLFVLNYLDKSISVVDTVNLVERGFGKVDYQTIKYINDNQPDRKNIGIYGADLRAVYNEILKKEFLIICGVDNDYVGRIKIIDINEKGNDGNVNKDYGAVLNDVVINFIPSNMAVSEDGDNIYIGSKDSNKFVGLILSSQGIVYVDTPMNTDKVRLNGSELFLIDSVRNMFSVYDIENKRFISVLPDSIFGVIKSQPFQIDHVRDIVFSPDTDIGGKINTVFNGKKCTGTVGYIINESGNIFALDISGCTYCEEADSSVAKVPCYVKGWFNLPVEDEIVNPTVSRPQLQIEDKILSYNDQGLAEYPYIERWDNSERNFGIGISRIFRSNMFNRNLQITYEGAIIQSTGIIKNGKFVPDITGFETLDISTADILDIRDINGEPLLNCNNGAVVETNEFRISSVSSDGISVKGNLPPDDCLEKYVFITRPLNGWSVTIDGYGFLGRAYENERFLLKDNNGYSHIDFTIKSGKNPSFRGMKFFSSILLYPYGFSPAEKMTGPASMKIVRDSVDIERFWGLVVFSGSRAIWQFSSKDLRSDLSILYK